MFKRILVCLIFPMMLIALFLALGGIQKVELDNTYYMFLRGVAQRFEGWKLTIPDIPQIPHLAEVSIFNVVLNVLISFFNGLIKFINVIVDIFNIMLNCLQFILTLLEYCMGYFSGYIDLHATA